MQIGRNEPCPCGSGKKYKKCCLASGRYQQAGRSQQASVEQQLELANSAFACGDIIRARAAIEPLLGRSRVPAAVWALACRIEMAAKEFALAASYMAKALTFEPDNPSYLYNHATLLALSGELEQAVDTFRRALAIKPDMWLAYPNLGNALRDLGRSSEAVECYQAAFDSDAIDLSTRSQILVSMHLFSTGDHDTLFQMHCAIGSEIAAQVPACSPQRANIERRDKLRLGYVSPRFSREIVGYFFKPLFDHHDRSKFEIYLYSATSRTDDLTSYFSAGADKWVDIGDLSDEAVCQQIVDDEIDVLIDLAGHAPENRMTAIARKPAPVQVAMLDYFDTTGVATMDYYVTDHYSTPPDSRQKFTEELIYLDHPRLVYEPPGYAPAVSRRTVDGTDFVFGSFNRPHKIVPHVIRTWSKLLAAVPSSRLVLKGTQYAAEDVQQSFLHRFMRCSIAPERIEFREASPHEAMLAEYADIDVALDTFPYNGGLTTCESLWMGTPVITLLGDSLISRQTAAMLHAIGLEEFIARSDDEFVEIGRYWAGNRDGLNAMRSGLRDAMLASPLTDAAGYTAGLEQQLERIWREFLSAHKA